MTPTEIEGLVSSLANELVTVSPDAPMAVRHGLTSGILKAQLTRALSQTIPRTTDEGMRVILAEECHRLGDVDGAANILAKAEPDFPVWSYAALAAMRRVSKTDEGRNAVIEECARAAHAKRSECDEAFYETNGSIYTEAYLDGISAAYDAIRALTTGGK